MDKPTIHLCGKANSTKTFTIRKSASDIITLAVAYRTEKASICNTACLAAVKDACKRYPRIKNIIINETNAYIDEQNAAALAVFDPFIDAIIAKDRDIDDKEAVMIQKVDKLFAPKIATLEQQIKAMHKLVGNLQTMKELAVKSEISQFETTMRPEIDSVATELYNVTKAFCDKMLLTYESDFAKQLEKIIQENNR
jgi:hypothetical protein